MPPKAIINKAQIPTASYIFVVPFGLRCGAVEVLLEGSTEFLIRHILCTIYRIISGGECIFKK